MTAARTSRRLARGVARALHGANRLVAHHAGTIGLLLLDVVLLVLAVVLGRAAWGQP